MKRVKLKEHNGFQYFLIALEKDESEKIPILIDEIEHLVLLRDDGVLEIDSEDICMFGDTKSISESDAAKYIPKMKFDLERFEIRKAFLKTIQTPPVISLDSEFYFTKCYAHGNPGGHNTARSSFNCALEQLNYPKFALVYKERVDNGTV